MAEQAPITRCKMKVDSVFPGVDGDGKKYGEAVRLSAVIGEDGTANKAWSEATPYASFELYISNPGAWGTLEVNQEYYCDFTPAAEAGA